MSAADILFGDYRDVNLLLKREFTGRDGSNRRSAAEAAFAAFPTLRMIASTQRVTHHSDRHAISARIDTPLASFETKPLDVPGVIDRVGTGDPFAAGVLHADRQGLQLEEVASTGLTLGILKHTVAGDIGALTMRHLD